MGDEKEILPTEEEVRGYMKELSNWGRWGPDDELGTINFITPEVRLAAIKTVQKGITVSCSRVVEFFSRSQDNPHQSTRFMLDTGLDRKIGDSSDSGVKSKRNVISEQIAMVFHGYTITHMDALAHFSWEGLMYNGRPVSLVDSQGVNAMSITTMKDGILTRGVLLDVAKVRGVEWVPPDSPVTIKDLEAAQKKFGVELRTGDVALIRTGLPKRRKVEGPIDYSKGSTALHVQCAPWLFKRNIAVLGSDTPNDITPAVYEGMKYPMHLVSLVAMGMPILDNTDLEELSQMCEKFNRYEFLISLSPLYLEATSGSPVNPIVTF